MDHSYKVSEYNTGHRDSREGVRSNYDTYGIEERKDEEDDEGVPTDTVPSSYAPTERDEKAAPAMMFQRVEAGKEVPIADNTQVEDFKSKTESKQGLGLQHINSMPEAIRHSVEVIGEIPDKG